MSIARQIIVRHRAEGHVRFSLPRELCTPFAGKLLEAELQRVEGIYRVDLYPRQGKLSIRYLEDAVDFQSLARALRSLVAKIETQSRESRGGAGKQLFQGKEKGKFGMAGWLKSRLQATRETITALGELSQQSAGARPLLTAEKEQILIDFCTDLLVLYLIKLHWHLIMGHWIRRPWQYSGEWMATLYLIFLLVRSRRPK